MKARGATVPLSLVCEEMYTNRDRRAEKSVGGEDGMGATSDCAVGGLKKSAGGPVVEALRSGFLRTGVSGVGIGEAGGRDSRTWGVMDGSTDWSRSSRKGAQK